MSYKELYQSWFSLISNILFSIIIHNKILFLKWCLKIDEIWYFLKNLEEILTYSENARNSNREIVQLMREFGF